METKPCARNKQASKQSREKQFLKL